MTGLHTLMSWAAAPTASPSQFHNPRLRSPQNPSMLWGAIFTRIRQALRRCVC